MKRTAASACIAIAFVTACGDVEVRGAPEEVPVGSGAPPSEHADQGGEPAGIDSRPPPMHQPIALWQDGHTAQEIDAATAREHGYVVVDLGNDWTPYLFTTRGNASEPEIPNSYRETYLALARGEFPRDHHGERAREDKYLELYGIMPTLTLVRERMRRTSQLACAANLELEVFRSFDGFIRSEGRDAARNSVRTARVLQNQITAIMQRQHVASREEINPEPLSDIDRRRLADYDRHVQRYRLVTALQQRLACEGYFEGRGRPVEGGFDWITQEALAEFERRHRIYGWGYLGLGTLEMMRRPPMEAEQEAVIRVLTERAMHSAGVIEDGSITAHWRAADGTEHEVPNLEGQIRTEVIEAFGLQTPESALAFLDALGEIPGERLVAIQGPTLPEYYSGDMDLTVEIDRGDIWYEFPYDERGQERPQPVERRPRLTIFTTYHEQRIPLARFGTTVGGWRSELIEGRTWWRYKNSPPGPVIWHQIVASPVWLPPESTPPRDLLSRIPRGRDAGQYRVNYHETGPSYASAYGLVAAYHVQYFRREDGSLRFGPDEGIRTHGSVDYMSIMRRHSHGCHRLHNHMAVRLMSFVLAHRRHTRVGNQALGFRRELVYEDQTYLMEIDRGGYVFQLERPIHVNVLEGRIRGDRETPIETPLPRFDPLYGAYMLPDGGAVAIARNGDMRSIPTPLPDGGPVDAGVRPMPVPAAPMAPVMPILR